MLSSFILSLFACQPIALSDLMGDECTDCDDTEDTGEPADTDTDTDLDIDTDTDADTDTDTDTDTDPVDEDGDGYSPEPEYDCNDSDATVYPGATEICDAVDNDCDGSIDEGLDCDNESELSVSADYTADHGLMTLNVQPIWNLSELGDWWWDSETITRDDVVVLKTTDDFEGILGLRFNVTASDDDNGDGGYDRSTWLCNGHYSTAALDASVDIAITVLGKSYTEANLVTWSPGSSGDTSLGCSALLWFAGSPTITEGYVK